MNIKITGKNIEITEAIKDYLEKRLEKLEKFSGKNTDINVYCSVEREEQIVEIQINHDGEFLRVEERNADLYASVDLAIDRAERQLRKEKEKRVEKSQSNSLKSKILGIFKGEERDTQGQVTKTRVYELKPLTLDDAKLKLEASKDMFLVYVDSETSAVNVLFKRDDGSFGMVIPE